MATDPKTAILDLLETNWDASQTVLADPPTFFSSWYTRDDDLPAISVPDFEESPHNGGDTGMTAFYRATGKSMQRLNGGATIDCVAGTWQDCEGVGANGDDLNPKAVRWSIFDHASSILVENAGGATGLRSVMPGATQDIVERPEDPDLKPVFRTQLRAIYVRDR